MTPPAKQSRLGKGLSALIGEVEGVGLATPDESASAPAPGSGGASGGRETSSTAPVPSNTRFGPVRRRASSIAQSPSS